MTKSEPITVGKLSQAEKVLLSMHKVSNGTYERVAFEDIVLQAWRDFPENFSLPNHPEYPDAAIVSKRLYGDLITKRLVVSLRNGVYRLSDKGLLESQKILNLTSPRDDIPKNNVQLNRDEEQFLDNALRSKTFSVWKMGNKDDLIDYDVRVFFQFSTGTPIRERKRRLESAREVIEKALALNMPDAIDLKGLFHFLIEKFPQLFQEK